MSVFERYREADARGNERIRDAMEWRPYTCVSFFEAAMSIVGGLVYTFVFADRDPDRFDPAWQSILAIGILWIFFAVFFIAERRRPFSRAIRRLLWWALLVAYSVMVSFCFFGTSGTRIGSSLYSGLRALTLLPVAALLWQFVPRKSD